MSEPYDPQPPPQDAPGPHSDLWTVTFRGAGGRLRLVPVFARSDSEARALARHDRRQGETIQRIDRGGTLSRAWGGP